MKNNFKNLKLKDPKNNKNNNQKMFFKIRNFNFQNFLKFNMNLMILN